MSRRCVAFLGLVSIFLAIAVLLKGAAPRCPSDPHIKTVWIVPPDNPGPCEGSEEGNGSGDGRAALQGKPLPGTDRYGDPLPKGALARLGTVRFRHQSLMAVVWSPDGKMLASAAFHGPIRLWDAATGKEVRRFDENGWNSVLAWSPDGKTLASAWYDEDSTIHLWDAATGKEVRRLDEHDGHYGVESLAWSPDGRTLASGGLIRLWDAATGKQIRRLSVKLSVNSLSWSPDGKALTSGGDDKLIRLWDAATGKEIRRLRGHDARIWSVHWSPDGKMLASGGDDKSVRLWDMASSKEVRRIVGASSASWSPDGKTLALKTGGETVHLWEAATGKPVCRIAGASEVFWSPDGKVLASKCHDAIRLWDPATGKEIQHREGHESFVTAVCWSPDGQIVASASYDKSIRLWDSATGKPIRTLRGHRHDIASLAWSPDGKNLASGSSYEPYYNAGVEGKSIRLWDTATGKEIRTLIGHTDKVESLAWSAEGNTVASASADKTLRLWDAATGKEIRKIAVATADRDAVIWAPDGKTLASVGGRDNAIHLLDAANGQELRRLIHEKTVWAAAWSADGRTLASASYDKTIHIWEAASGKEIRRFAENDVLVRSLAWSPDGKTLALGCQDSTVRLWEAATGKEVCRFPGHESTVCYVDWSPDGLMVASNAGDSILLWDITGRRADGRWHIKPLTPHQLEACWSALANDDAAKAYDAVWALVATPEQAVPFLRKHLTPVPPPDVKTVARLIADLDSNDFQVRQKATDKLSKLGDAAAPALRQALEGKPSLEMRRRLQQLLDQTHDWTPQRLRSHRAIQVLEHIGTRQARDVLHALDAGAPQARRTQEAKEALQRLGHASSPRKN